MSEKIAVVGAGLAGLTCAYRLQKMGFDVDVFEARPRLGGRIFSLQLAKSLAEMSGIAAFDRYGAPHMHRLLEELDINFGADYIPFDFLFLDENERQALKERIRCRLPIHEPDILDVYVKESETLGDAIDLYFKEDPTLAHYFALQVSCYEGVPAHTLKPDYLYTTFVYFYNRVIEQCQNDREEEDAHVEGNHTKLIHSLAHHLKGKIHHNSFLKEVQFTSEGVLLDFGETFYFDKVVIAIPSCFLSEIDFGESILPYEHQQVIDLLSLGRHQKKQKKAPQFQKTLPAIKKHENSVITVYYAKRHAALEAISDSYQQAKREVNILFQRTSIDDYFESVKQAAQACITVNATVAIQATGTCARSGISTQLSTKADHILSKKYRLGDHMIRQSFRPVDDRIFFAGEHIVFEETATLEGAVESGEIIARYIGIENE